MRRNKRYRKANKKPAFIMLVTLLAVGVSYGYFSETLNIVGQSNSLPFSDNPIDPVVIDPGIGSVIITPPPGNFGDAETIIEEDQLTIIYQQQTVQTQGYLYTWENLQFNIVNNTNYIWTQGQISVVEVQNATYLSSVSHWVLNPWLPPGGIGGIGMVYRLNNGSFTSPIQVKYRLTYKINGITEEFFFILRINPL